MKVILSRTWCEPDFDYRKKTHFFFLAGPVRGGGDWQMKCCEFLERLDPTCIIAIPCRYPPDHSLRSSELVGVPNFFSRQLNWERYYMEIAATYGCLLFWLPCESKDVPREGDEPYAMDTRGELGEWRGRLIANPNLKIVIGAEAKFPGLSQIQRNFNCALGRDFLIYPTLEETVLAAVRVCKS